jgi:hypothetical protein
MLEHQLKDNTVDDDEPECIACNVKRIVTAVTPVAAGYEMLSLECPECSNLLMLVVPHRGARELERRIVPCPPRRQGGV